jgi:hypothetical protein
MPLTTARGSSLLLTTTVCGLVQHLDFQHGFFSLPGSAYDGVRKLLASASISLMGRRRSDARLLRISSSQSCSSSNVFGLACSILFPAGPADAGGSRMSSACRSLGKPLDRRTFETVRLPDDGVL